MGFFIPNENSYVGFVPALTGSVSEPKVADITAAIELTGMCVSVNAATSGNNVPTPALDSLFERSIPGTTTASFTSDLYRDDVKAQDIAWAAVPRGTSGFFLIARYGGKPAVGDDVEVWPVRVTSRSNSNMASNTASTFTLTCAVPIEPDDDAVVAA